MTTVGERVLIDVGREADGARVVTVTGALTLETVATAREALRRLVTGRAREDVRVDLGGVEAIDNFGVAMFGAVAAEARGRGVGFGVTRFSPLAAEAFRQAPGPTTPLRAGAARATWLEGLGEGVARGWERAVDFVVLTADTFGLLFGGARRTRRVRRGATAVEAVRIGVDALPIVGLISFLVGLVVALQSAYQLARFGASIYVADLIAVSMTREMGPLMTAIIIAGRSGASIAAEIATMRVTEEIDAIYVMGLEPTRYIVVPKFLGMTMTMPLLVAFANVLGIFGGFLVSFLYLGVGAGAFWNQVGDALVLKDVLTGLTKSVAFAWIIVLVAAHRGFAAHGGAESVGRVTTESVVSSIFWVIVADAVFSLVFYFG